MPDNVAIGGLGGSGTRVGAAMLQALGYYIGSDLNGPLDNLWYTLLFKRRSVLLDDPRRFEHLFELFCRRMGGDPASMSAPEIELIESLARSDRLQHAAEWLAQRAASFLDMADSRDAPPNAWGWKEPNTHIFADRFLALKTDLKYVHFHRDPFYMAYSSNQNQLQNWGPILLDEDVAIGPRAAMTYWCRIHRRVDALAQDHPGRVLVVDYDALCADPHRQAHAIASFIGAELSPSAMASIEGNIDAKRSSKPERRPGDFDPADLAYLAEIGVA